MSYSLPTQAAVRRRPAVPLARLRAQAAGGLSVALATGAVSIVTVLNKFGPLPLRDLAASERAVGEGRVWLLVTSAFVADRPAVPSIAGLAIVGLAVLAFCGVRLLLATAALGHVGGTVAVYGGLALAHAADHGLATHAMGSADYGTSAIIAAWIGVIAYAVWRRGSGVAALALCVLSGLVGWLFRPDLDVLDTEHLVALGIGIALAASIGVGAGAGASSGAGSAASSGQASLQAVRSRAARSPAEAKT
ncbi:MAG: hypothetical protein QOD43_2061 [Gaiellaceae bacterium]|nr:hypothetical protein [Gaiellaceae bacterium]